MTVTVPTIHLNGSGKERLLEDYKAAHRAVALAAEALCATTPHGRDYYVRGDDVIMQALAEHRARQQLLDTVERQLAEIIIGIDGQGR